MKSYYLLLATFMLLVFACRKSAGDEQLPIPLFPGTAMVELNGDTVLASTTTLFPRGGSASIHDLIIRLEYPGANLTPNLNFIQLPLRLDTFPLQTPFSSPFTFPATEFYLANGDAQGEFYHLLEMDSVVDFIKFTKLDTVTKQVEGIFQASFAIDTNFIDFALRSLPDTLIFRNGTFQTKLQ